MQKLPMPSRPVLVLAVLLALPVPALAHGPAWAYYVVWLVLALGLALLIGVFYGLARWLHGRPRKRKG